MNRERILKLNEMLKDSCAGELEVREGDIRIRIRRMPPALSEPACADTAVGGVDAQPADVDPLTNATIVTAHIVGLFHRGSAPGGAALVEVGDQVDQGQCIGTIEALRNFTEVSCPIDGTVVGVLAEDGAPVQYGDPLLAVRPK